LLPSYRNNASKVLAVTTNNGDVEWIAVSNTVTDGASITNLQASNLVGVIPIANGGTGQTNAAAAIEALLPAYTNNASKFLALNTNATALEWVTNSGGGGGGLTSPVAIADGGTGQTNALAAATAIFYGNFSDTNTGASHMFIGLDNTNTTGGGDGIGIGVANNVESGDSIAIGKLNTVNSTEAVAIGFENLSGNDSVAIGFLSYAYGNKDISIGVGAVSTNGGNNVAIGNNAKAREGNIAIGMDTLATGSSGGGVAIGRGAYGTNNGVAIGRDALASSTGAAVGRSAQVRNGFAGGGYAYALGTNSVQLGDGYNNTSETIQFRNAGLVDTNEWAYLASVSTKGGSRMTNTNGVTATNTIIGYDGTNYTTNTITVIDGIITSWTQ